MPFAPVVREARAEEVFEISGLNANTARFMTITTRVRPQWRDRIAAIVHVDGTARPQIIKRETNALYYDIVEEFERSSGLPVLVNTSFNVHEEPIVNRPEECARALLEGRIDFVVTERDLYVKNGAAPPTTGTAACIASRAACWRCRRERLRRRRRRAKSSSARTAVAATTGFERREHTLPVGLPERNEPHAGGDHVGGDRVQIGVQRRLERDAVAGGGDADRDRIGDRSIPRRGSRSSAAHGQAARVASTKARALRRRLEMPLLR